MTSRKSENNPRRESGRPVRAPYTFPKLKDDVQRLHRSKSLRAIAGDYGVTHGAVQRVLDGHEPKSPAIRKAFKLTDMVPAPVCPKCGVVHVTKRCTNRKPSTTPRRNWKKAYTWAASMVLFMAGTK